MTISASAPKVDYDTGYTVLTSSDAGSEMRASSSSSILPKHNVREYFLQASRHLPLGYVTLGLPYSDRDLVQTVSRC
jgi:hypothetical protein